MFGKHVMAWYIILTVSFGQSLHQFVVLSTLRGQIELCESRDGRLGSPSLIVPTVSVDVKQH